MPLPKPPVRRTMFGSTFPSGIRKSRVVLPVRKKKAVAQADPNAAPKHYKITPSLIQDTSAVGNNCALAAGSVAVARVLLSLKGDELNAAGSTQLAFRDCFVNYFSLPATTTLSNIQAVLRRYSNPQDLGLILAPVLRKYLQYLLINDLDTKTKFYNYPNYLGFKSGLRSFLMSSGASTNIFSQSSPKTFADWLTNYQKFCNASIPHRALNDDKTYNAFFTTPCETEVHDLWYNTCSNEYANEIGEKNKFLSDEEAAVVYNKFGITLHAYTFEKPIVGADAIAAANYDKRIYPAARNSPIVKMVNNSFIHWETIADDINNASAHKAVYHATSELKQISTRILTNAVTAACLRDAATTTVAQIDRVDSSTQVENKTTGSTQQINGVPTTTEVNKLPALPQANRKTQKSKWRWLEELNAARSETSWHKAVKDKSSNEPKPAGGVVEYSYLDSLKNEYVFWVSTKRQIYLDELLAKAIQSSGDNVHNSKAHRKS